MKPDFPFPLCASCLHARYVADGRPLYCERLRKTPAQDFTLAHCHVFEYEPGTDAEGR